jgi:hypothetical protein
MRRTVMVVLVAGLAAVWAGAGPAGSSRLPGEVVRYAGSAQTLGARVAWALQDAAKFEPGRGLWVGYSIRRLMGENEMVGSFKGRQGAATRDVTIEEVLAGKKKLETPPADSVRRTAKEVLDGLEHPKKAEKKILKDIGIFLGYEAGRPATLRNVDMSNLDLAFDFKGRPLYWLGDASEDESLEVIKGLFSKAGPGKAKEGLVAAAGMHGDARLVIPFLEKVLTGGESDGLRKDAAFWIGQQNDPAGLRILLRAAKTDRSQEVREGAVFAISQVALPEAVDELIALAKDAAQADVRKQAVFWLGEIASEKTAPALVEFASKGGDIEVQEQAIFALSELPENQGVEPLIKLAKTHPDPRVRKKAVFWLGESHDPRALEALIAIIKGK